MYALLNISQCGGDDNAIFSFITSCRDVRITLWDKLYVYVCVCVCMCVYVCVCVCVCVLVRLRVFFSFSTSLSLYP